MRIDRLELQNFKGIAEQAYNFPCQFNLLVGNNGTGKTNVLDAAAVALGVWLIDTPDSRLLTSKRPILEKEIRLREEPVGDRVQFAECYPVKVAAVGCIAEQKGLRWTSLISAAGRNITRPDSNEVRDLIQEIFAQNGNGIRTICPVIAYYGAGRAWLPSNSAKKAGEPNEGIDDSASGDATLSGTEDSPGTIPVRSRRWAAFYDCLSERIRFGQLKDWFRGETTAAGSRGGRMRPGFEVVRRAVIGCVPEATEIWFDSDRDDIVFRINGKSQPFANLSAGQRMMLALISDLAIRCVTQNAHLLPADELGPEAPRVLAETPGVVLIDELDVHLHPVWQRRVVADLKNTFPKIQFICTSHSPQVIGELAPEEVQFLDDGVPSHPGQSFGMDSNWILNVLMGGDDKNKQVEEDLEHIKDLLGRKDPASASTILQKLRGKVGNSVAIQRAASSIERFKLLGR